MKKKRSLSLHGHRTSIALEAEFWDVIEKEAFNRNQALASFLAELDDQRIIEGNKSGLASFLRVWALKHVQSLNQR